MKKLFNLTQDGLEELKEELKQLLGQRPIIADRIKQARELGDLSENAEYQTAREEQDRLESRIGELEHVVQNSKLIKKNKGKDQVKLGSSVKLKTADGQLKQFQVVGTIEADPSSGKISDESPIGKALIGKKVGDRFEVKLPTEDCVYKVISIS
ncbi:transcription elongation factor GreA [bacterium G20]|nr:transcription elongation factor GreA [bacterium G20]